MFHISRDKWREDPQTAVMNVYTAYRDNTITISLVGKPGRNSKGEATLSCILSVDDAKEVKDQITRYLSRKPKKPDPMYNRFRSIERD